MYDYVCMLQLLPFLVNKDLYKHACRPDSAIVLTNFSGCTRSRCTLTDGKPNKTIHPSDTHRWRR